MAKTQGSANLKQIKRQLEEAEAKKLEKGLVLKQER